MWRRSVAGLLIGVLLFEAGAAAPASSVSAATHVVDAEVGAPIQASPQRSPAQQPGVSASEPCDGHWWCFEVTIANPAVPFVTGPSLAGYPGNPVLTVGQAYTVYLKHQGLAKTGQATWTEKVWLNELNGGNPPADQCTPSGGPWNYTNGDWEWMGVGETKSNTWPSWTYAAGVLQCGTAGKVNGDLVARQVNFNMPTDATTKWTVWMDPVLASEPVPPETERNAHPNTETSGDPVNTFTGSLTTTRQDVAIPGRGPAVDFRRTYNSNDPRAGPLGPGWTHSYATRLVLADDASGDMYLIGPQGRSDRYTRNPDGSFTSPAAIHRQLVKNLDATFTATAKDGSSWSFDTGGRLAALSDRYGNASNLIYGAGGRLVSIGDPAGRGTLTLAYTNGLLTSVTDWASPARTVTYQYDANGRLWKVTDREGQTTTYTYEGTSQRIATITDARGNVVLTNTYDVPGRVATQKDARGLVTGDMTTYGYVVNPDATRVTTITAPPTSFEPSFNPSQTDSYDANGWLVTRVIRPTSAETLTQSFTYDATGNRTSFTDARGNRTDLCYDVDYAGSPIVGSAGDLTRRIDAAPATGANRPVALFQYDTKHNVIQTVAPKGMPSSATVTCTTDLSAINGAYAVDFTYDAAGAALLAVTARFTDPDSGLQTTVTKYEYIDAANPGLVTRVIPPRGNTAPSPDYTYATTFTYYTTGSTSGLLKDVSDPLGNKASYDYDAVGRLISTVDPLGNASGGVPSEHTTQFSYDKEDRLRFRTLPAPVAGGAGLVDETRYDAAGNPIVRIAANGQVAMFGYDERNSLATVTQSAQPWTDPASPPGTVIVTQYAYDAGGNVTRMTRATGDSQNERVTDYAYEGRGLLRGETQYPTWPSTAGALLTTYAFDPNGNRLTLVDPLAKTTTFAYDALDRLTSVDYSDPATPDVAFAYDAQGNRTSMTDGTGTTTYSHDELDQLLSVASPGPKTVAYRYDLDGNRTKLIYPDATAVTYTFDKGGQLSSLSDWASRSVAYAYWPDGLVKTATNPNASVTSYRYDNARRLLEISHAGPLAQILDRVIYTLDSVGNVTGLVNGTFDPQFGRPDGLSGSSGTWSGTFADINEVVPNDATFLASPSGPSSTTFYEVSLSDIEPPGVRTGITVRYHYAKSGDNGGQPINLTVELRQGSTVVASQAHTNIPGVSGSGWQQGSFTLTEAQANAITNFNDLRLRFRPSAGGSGQKRKGQISWAEVQFPGPGDPASLISYSYDRLSRLAGVTGASGSRSYTYDPVGNRLTKEEGGTTTYSYDRADRITTAGSSSVTVDAAGNLTARGADTFAYDAGNRLTSANVGGVSEAYAYDGDGLRFSRQVGGDPAIRYVSDVDSGLPVILDDGSRKYVWGLGLAYAVAGSALEVYHADRLGSVRELTDATGAVIATYRTDEWGIPTQATGTSSQPFRFTGEPLDGTGLVYLRARYYDPSVAVFVSRDTWPGSTASPQSLNRYAYATGNPTTFSDPSGHYGVDVVADVAFIAYDIFSLLLGPEKERETNQLGRGVRCGVALLGAFTVFEASTALAAGGLALQGFSVAVFGISLGAATPVTVAGVTAGLFLEATAIAGYATGIYLIHQVCIEGR